MDYRCPSCEASLEQKNIPLRMVPEGTPFYRATGRSRICPFCRTPIRRNENPAAESLFAIQVIGIVFLVLATAQLSIWALAGAIIFVVASGTRLWYMRRFLREWRYWV